MKLILTLFSVLLLPSFSLAQIFPDPYVEGVYRNDVVYIGSYESPGNCTWADGVDFIFDFSMLLLPDGLESVLIIDEPIPSNTPLMNGWLTVDVGDSTTFDSSTNTLGISATSGPATINFHIRTVGIPTSAGQELPCWIDGSVTDAACGSTYAVYAGESLVPCYVEQVVGISEMEKEADIRFNGNELSILTECIGQLSVFSMGGKLMMERNILSGFTYMSLQSLPAGNYIVRFSGSYNSISKIILLQ